MSKIYEKPELIDMNAINTQKGQGLCMSGSSTIGSCSAGTRTEDKCSTGGSPDNCSNGGSVGHMDCVNGPTPGDVCGSGSSA